MCKKRESILKEVGQSCDVEFSLKLISVYMYVTYIHVVYLTRFLVPVLIFRESSVLNNFCQLLIVFALSYVLLRAI